MQDTRRQLIEAIAILDREEENEALEAKLKRYEQMDVKKIIETEEGYWAMVPLKYRCKEFADVESRYPRRIPSLLTQPLTQFREVKYFLCGKEIPAAPSKATVMLAGGECTILVDGKIKYRYVFAKKESELYSVLYSLACL